jgi:hypothetical protein
MRLPFEISAGPAPLVQVKFRLKMVKLRFDLSVGQRE